MKTLLFIAWIGSYSADAGTTAKALSNGGVEQIMTQKTSINNSIFITEAASGLVLANRFWSRHPRLVKISLLSGIAIEGASAVHNFGTIAIQNGMK